MRRLFFEEKFYWIDIENAQALKFPRFVPILMVVFVAGICFVQNLANFGG
jgi:hypothetical protein